MKSLFTITLIYLSYFGFAGDNSIAKRKVTHHIQFLWGNYFSLTKFSYPMYTYSVGFDYTAEFTPILGLKTGLNYFTYGMDGESLFSYEQTSPKLYFSSFLHIPANLIVHKDLRRGRLVFSVGPDIYLPTNSFGQDIRSTIRHSHDSPTNFLKEGTLGFSVGLGYEKKISNKFSLEFMPDYRILNVLPFNTHSDHTLNIAIGLSTYLTFY